MKKLLLLILTITLLFGLGACSSSPEYDDNELVTQLDELEARVLELETIMEQVGFLQGLNGIEIPYLIPQSNMMALSYTPLGDDVKVKDEDFDKNKTAPSYIIDEIGNYISFEDISVLLKAKYFPNVVDGEETDIAYMQATCGMVYWDYDGELVLEDVIARTVLLIQELQQYSFYVLSSNMISIKYFKIDNGFISSFEITIPLVVVINDFFEITAEKVVDGFYEMYLNVTDYDVNTDLVIQYYNDYVLADTFSGYVLNMGE